MSINTQIHYEEQEAFDVHTTQVTVGDEKLYRVQIKSAATRDNGGVPTNVQELVLTQRQMARLHVETEPWQPNLLQRGGTA